MVLVRNHSSVHLFMLAIGLGVVRTQLLHSVDRMSKALDSYYDLADKLEKFIREEEVRLRNIERLADSLSDSMTDYDLDELERVLSNPVRVLRTVSQFAQEAESVRAELEQPAALKDDLLEHLNNVSSYGEYSAASMAIIRLEEIYDIDFTEAQLPAQDSADKIGEESINGDEESLSVTEVYDLALVAQQAGDLYSATVKMDQAREMYLNAGNEGKAMECLDQIAYFFNLEGAYNYALNYTYQVLDYYIDQVNADHDEIIDRLESNIDLYINELGGDEKAAEVVPITKPYEFERTSMPHPYYCELCRGLSVKGRSPSRRPLFCFYESNGCPSLFLAPAKVEELTDRSLGLRFYHDVISDREIELFKQIASKKFYNSEVLVEENVTAVDETRSSNSAWVYDSEDSGILTVSRRLQVITGLTIKNAEPYQILSYGVGGFYYPHHDYTKSNTFGFRGDRLATWIFYLNNVKKGGATVFPKVGATIWPEKGGAAFWWNLHKSGAPNKLTLHAACPVLEGFKWAGNKWFHEAGNELHQRCPASPSK